MRGSPVLEIAKLKDVFHKQVGKSVAVHVRHHYPVRLQETAGVMHQDITGMCIPFATAPVNVKIVRTFTGCGVDDVRQGVPININKSTLLLAGDIPLGGGLVMAMVLMLSGL